jgi:hypothetical protein
VVTFISMRRAMLIRVVVPNHHGERVVALLIAALPV